MEFIQEIIYLIKQKMGYMEYSSIGIYWTALYALSNNVTYFDSSGVEHIPKKKLNNIKGSLITAIIFKIQAYDSVLCGYFCIGFIYFMLKGKVLSDFTNCFSLNSFQEMMT